MTKLFKLKRNQKGYLGVDPIFRTTVGDLDNIFGVNKYDRGLEDKHLFFKILNIKNFKEGDVVKLNVKEVHFMKKDKRGKEMHLVTCYAMEPEFNDLYGVWITDKSVDIVQGFSPMFSVDCNIFEDNLDDLKDKFEGFYNGCWNDVENAILKYIEKNKDEYYKNKASVDKAKEFVKEGISDIDTEDLIFRAETIKYDYRPIDGGKIKIHEDQQYDEYDSPNCFIYEIGGIRLFSEYNLDLWGYENEHFVCSSNKYYPKDLFELCINYIPTIKYFLKMINAQYNPSDRIKTTRLHELSTKEEARSKLNEYTESVELVYTNKYAYIRKHIDYFIKKEYYPSESIAIPGRRIWTKDFTKYIVYRREFYSIEYLYTPDESVISRLNKIYVRYDNIPEVHN